MKQRIRVYSLFLVAALLLSVLPAPARATAVFTRAEGWFESIAAELSGVTDGEVTAVAYAGPVSGTLQGDDLTYLVRDMEGGVRIDIPGLPAGEYTLTVETTAGSLTQEGITVSAYDRSGYAHWNYTRGVGAYNDDGTLKDNAVVLYVTEENKNTVTVTASDGTTVSGIGNILNTGGRDTGGGKSSKGGLANTNQEILKKLANDGVALVIRIVGTVTTPEGLTAWGSIDYGGNEDDNGAMARMQFCRDITIEGIGPDAVINGWGFSVIANTGARAAGYGESFEFRNLTFTNVPEDCIGLEGTQSGSNLTDPIERCWVHNCAFYGPTNVPDASDDQDKGGGDGACDFKRGQYYTMSYCYYYGYHKTNLIGGSDSNLQYNITWHHNYYKNCQSRAPLTRQANMHIYNNIFENQSSYCMSLRANCYIFSEYNLYLNCKKVSDNKRGGVCKSYMNTFSGCTGTDTTDLIIVTDRSQTVTSKNKNANFDTDPTLGYVASGNYALDEDMELVRTHVQSYAGPMGCAFTAPSVPAPPKPDVPGTPDTPEIPGDTPPDITVNSSSFVHNFTESGLNSDFYAFDGNLSEKGTVLFGRLELTRCLKIESSTSITFTAPSDGTLSLIFGGSTPAAGKSIKIDGVKTTISSAQTLSVPISKGSHTITKADYIFLYYMIYTPAGGEITVNKEGSLITSVDVTPNSGTTELTVPEVIPNLVPIRVVLRQGEALTLTIPAAKPWGTLVCHTTPSGGYIMRYDTLVTEGGLRITLTESGEYKLMGKALTFPDISADFWAKNEIDYVTARSIMNGKVGGSFVPTEAITRKTVALILWRLEGQPKVAVDTVLSDVNRNDRYTQAICWAEDAGIITGYTDGTFRPDATLSRQHFAVMLYRFARYKQLQLIPENEKPLTDFHDYDAIGTSFREACGWAAGNGLINGRATGDFDPQGYTSRAQLAVILCRFLQKYYPATV